MTNEMNDDYAANVVGTIELPLVPTITQDGEGVDPSTVIGDRGAMGISPANVCIYADCINPISYMGDDPIIAFDVVFSVAVTCPETNTIETYKVVKRIGVDRMKMADQAKSTTPVSVLEAKDEGAEKAKAAQKVRARQLAGLI